MSYGTITILRYIITKLSISRIRGLIIVKMLNKMKRIHADMLHARNPSYRTWEWNQAFLFLTENFRYGDEMILVPPQEFGAGTRVVYHTN